MNPVEGARTFSDFCSLSDFCSSPIDSSETGWFEVSGIVSVPAPLRLASVALSSSSNESFGDAGGVASVAESSVGKDGEGVFGSELDSKDVLMSLALSSSGESLAEPSEEPSGSGALMLGPSSPCSMAREVASFLLISEMSSAEEEEENETNWLSKSLVMFSVMSC